MIDSAAPLLLACSQARIDLDGAAVVDELTCASSARHVALVGYWDPLFDVAAGRALLAAGTVEVAGADLRSGVIAGSVGLAPFEPELPPRWSCEQYLEHSAELAGPGSRHALERARALLGTLQLPGLWSRRLSSFTRLERRILQIVHATLTAPDVLLLQTPLAALDDREQEWLVWVIQHAARERALIVSAPYAPPAGPERNLIDSMQEVLALEAGEALVQGPPAVVLAAGPRYRLTVLHNGLRLQQALAEQGLELAPAAPSDAQPARFVVHVPQPAILAQLIDAALAAEAPIVELVPVGFAAPSLAAAPSA